MPEETFNDRRPDPPADDSTLTASPGLVHAQLTARPGDRFGRYKILEEIGQGGCGAVFVAEQEEPVRRLVALKVIKLGMDTRQVIARFEAEQQALAMMDHPNIAKVLDAGATDTGRPFFVMELVRGIKITDYCDQNRLSTSDRLKLFIQVCQAVQHAHQKGIIHRDLKPSNILVTLHDGVPVPKVIDFGIAKATANQKLTDKTIYTALEQFIGTPAYMSPEQAEMTGLDIDTRSDIYSLGVLLYELLIGETPFSSEELLGVGLDAMRRILREKDPARPSAKLSTMTAADLTAIALHRQSEPPKLINSVHGDLDWIVMKCLEKERSRRYETADALAMDLQRHIHNEPILARPPSKFYEFQKSVQRHKFGFAAATILVLVLTIGVVVSTREAIRATRAEQEQKRARAEATTDAARSQQVARFLEDMLNGVGPSVAQGSDTKLLREILGKTAERVGRDLTNEPQVEIELRGTMGRVYNAISEYGEAEKMLRAAVGLCRTLPPGNEAQLATLLDDLGMVLWREGKEADAQSAVKEAVALRRRRTDEEGLRALALTLNSLATVIVDESFPAAETALREALEIQQKLLDKNDPATLTTQVNLAYVLMRRHKRDEAEPILRKVVAAEKTLPADQAPMLATALNLLGLITPDNVEAEALLRQALEIRRKLYPKDHADLAQSLSNLGRVMKTNGDLKGAETNITEALEMRRRLFPKGSRELARNLNDLGLLEQKEGKLAEAEAADREALAMRRTLLGDGNLSTIGSFDVLSSVLEAQGKLAEAESVTREAVAICRNQHRTSELVRAAARLGAILLQEKKGVEEAEALLREVISRKEEFLAKHDRTIDDALGDLARLLEGQRKFREAEIVWREELEVEKVLSGSEHPFVANSMMDLAGSLTQQGKYSEAETIFREALAMRRRLLGNEHAQVEDALSWLGYCLVSQGKNSSAKALYCEVAEQGNAFAQDAAAWLMATGPQDVRDGQYAVEFSEKAVAKTSRTNAPYLNTLAAALAETGQFTNAVRIQKEAMALLATELERKDYSARLKLYEAHIPYRDAGPLAWECFVLLEKGDFAEAEPMARECLALREKQTPDDWLTFNARSMLGGALLGQKRFAEAEPLLLSGYEGMQQRGASILAVGGTNPREALQRLVELYERTDRPALAAEYKRKLAESQKPEK